MWIRHVASSVNSKLNHLSFDFRLFKNMSIDHRRIEEFMKSLCPLSAMKCLAVDHLRSACDTAKTMPIYPLVIKRSLCTAWVSKGGRGEGCFLFG